LQRRKGARRSEANRAVRKPEHFSLDGPTRLSEHPSPMKRHQNRGDAMMTVLIVLFAAVVLVASMLG